MNEGGKMIVRNTRRSAHSKRIGVWINFIRKLIATGDIRVTVPSESLVANVSTRTLASLFLKNHRNLPMSTPSC